MFNPVLVKIEWYLEVFYKGPITQVLSFIFIKVFIGILGEGFEIQFCAIFYVDFNKDLIKFEIEFVFICIIKVFIGILGESIEIQVLALFYIDFNQGFNHI